MFDTLFWELRSAMEMSFLPPLVLVLIENLASSSALFNGLKAEPTLVLGLHEKPGEPF